MDRLGASREDMVVALAALSPLLISLRCKYLMGNAMPLELYIKFAQSQMCWTNRIRFLVCARASIGRAVRGSEDAIQEGGVLAGAHCLSGSRRHGRMDGGPTRAEAVAVDVDADGRADWMWHG